MPVYCFKCKCGRTAEEQRMMADFDKPKHCDCGEDMSRDLAAELPRSGACDTYPHASYAMGGGPDEIPFMIELDKKLRAPKTEYNRQGDPVFTGRKHRRDYCRAHKVHDRNACYSDPVQD